MSVIYVKPTAPSYTALTTSSSSLTTQPWLDSSAAEVQQLAFWCSENNLSLNVDKTKEMIVDFRKPHSTHTPLSIRSSMIETVNSIKLLGVHISDDLTWSTNTTSITKKAQQCLRFLRHLKRANLPPPTLTAFYRGTIESVLTSCIPVWFGNCKVGNLSQLHGIVKAAAKINRTSLPLLQDIFHKRCISKASCIVRDPSHPSHGLFSLLPSGRCYRSIGARFSRLRDKPSDS